MSRLNSSLLIAMLAGTLAAGPAYAQATNPPAGTPQATTPSTDRVPPESKATADRKAASQKAAADRKAASDAKAKADPSVWDQTKDMTRKQWNEAKKKWATEKQQWRDCNNQAKKEKLAAPKSWSFIASCMTKS